VPGPLRREPGVPTCCHRVAFPYVIVVRLVRAGLTREAESIWMAEASDGQLVELSNGLTREEIAATLIDAAERHDRLVVARPCSMGQP
jgi:hypothetical protein